MTAQQTFEAPPLRKPRPPPPKSTARRPPEPREAACSPAPVGANPVAICCDDAEGDADIDLAIIDLEPDGPRVVRTLRNDLADGILQFAEAEVLDDAASPFAVVAADIAVFLNDFVPPPPICPGDLDDDDDTDVFDFALFAPAFGTQMGDPGFLPAADLNDDLAIDVFDFAIFAPDFGCTP